MRRRVLGWLRSLQGRVSGDTPGSQPAYARAQAGSGGPEDQPYEDRQQQPVELPTNQAQPGFDDITRNFEASLDEVKQYLGVLRRQNIAMSIKVARTERCIEELSARLETLGGSPSPDAFNPDHGGLAET